jgi:hypothetical protein
VLVDLGFLCTLTLLGNTNSHIYIPNLCPYFWSFQTSELETSKLVKAALFLLSLLRKEELATVISSYLPVQEDHQSGKLQASQ